MGVLFGGRRLPARIGRGGVVADKREGDGGTPAAGFRVAGMFYRPDRIAPHLLPDWARPIGLRDLWCDASGHPDYNQLVRAPFAASAETMRRADALYDLVITTDWNWPEAVPGRGSAIFLHQRRGPGHPTAGCIALRRDHLLWLAQRVAPGTEILIARR